MKTLDVKGYEVKVDDDLYLLLKSKRWHPLYSGTTYIADGSGNLMHRLIMGLDDPNLVIDHINHDTLDNRRENLRVCTKSQNSCNRVPFNKGTKYIGVSRCKYRDGSYVKKSGHVTKYFGKERFFAYVTLKGKRVWGAYFFDIEHAAISRDHMAKKYHGEFAVLNFPDGKEIH